MALSQPYIFILSTTKVLNLLKELSCWSIIQKVPYQYIVDVFLCDFYFFYFNSFLPLKGFCFIFPSQYLCTIDESCIFSYRGWDPGFHSNFLSNYSKDFIFFFLHRTFTFFGWTFPRSIRKKKIQSMLKLAFNVSISLATTFKISIDWFSFN